MSELCWKIENDICRCCHGEGSFANLAVPQSIDGREEVYADMLRESLDINLVQVEGEMNNMTYTICGICIMRLRDAFMFKQQVLQCEDKFQEMYAKKFIQVSLPLKTSIKVELIDSDSADDEFILRDTDKDEDNDEIITTKIKQEKADAPEKKRLRPRKVAEKPKKAPMLKKMLTKKTQLKKKKKEEEEKKESEAEKNSVDREYYYEVELQCLDTKDPLVTKIKKEEEEESPPQEQTRQGTAESLVKEEGKVDTKKKKGDGVTKKRKPRKAETVPRKRKDIGTSVQVKVEKEPLKNEPNIPDCYDHNEHDDCYESMDVKEHVSDPESSNIEVTAPRKKSKREKKSKNGIKKRSKTSDEEAKKEMLTKLNEMNEQLDRLRAIEEDMEEDLPLSEVKPRQSDRRGLHNTVNIIEHSYVCPFDTSFSDYYCIYCREVYTDPSKLREHTLTHDPGKFKELAINKKITQIDIVRIDCRLCPIHIPDLDSLREHLASVHGKMFYNVNDEFLKFKLSYTNLTCTECNSSFSFFHALKKHMAEHFGSCICDVCGAHYFEERMLVLHQRSHQRNDKNFPCKECGKIFKSKHSRYLHIARAHKKEPVYQCSKCDEVLFSYSQRYRHMIEVHGEERLYQCDSCDRSYDSRKSLREHNRRFHLRIFKHQCDLCDKRFYLPSRLKEHMATHTGERNFRCECCGKSYSRLRALTVHMQSHISEKKYRCQLCSASFTQNVNLKNHMKRQHQSLDLEDGFHN